MCRRRSRGTYYFSGYSGSQTLKLAQRRRPLVLADFKAEPPVRDAVRKEFPDAIFWLPDFVTDANGEGTVSITYPDSLTTWRLTARAVTADTRAGVAVTRTTTTKDVIVRLAPPRFLTEGDVGARACRDPQLPLTGRVLRRERRRPGSQRSRCGRGRHAQGVHCDRVVKTGRRGRSTPTAWARRH